MLEPIEIIYDVKSLVGSCYIEIKPGKYVSEHWGETSIYFTDEHFALLSRAIVKYYARYSPWGLSEIDRRTWALILDELEKLKSLLQNNPTVDDIEKYSVFWYVETTKNNFAENLTKNVADLLRVVTEFQAWITENSKDNAYISILGI